MIVRAPVLTIVDGVFGRRRRRVVFDRGSGGVGRPGRPRRLGVVDDGCGAVVAHLGAVGIENHHRLLEVGLRVALDLLVAQHRALGGTARRVADPRRVVADDQDSRVTLVLEGAHALQRDAAADVDIGGGDVNPELDPQRTLELQLLLEPALREHVDRVAS